MNSDQTDPAKIVRIAVDFAGNGDDEVRSIWGFDAEGRMTLLALRTRRVGIEVACG